MRIALGSSAIRLWQLGHILPFFGEVTGTCAVENVGSGNEIVEGGEIAGMVESVFGTYVALGCASVVGPIAPNDVPDCIVDVGGGGILPVSGNGLIGPKKGIASGINPSK
jgi:hypothetical protein